MHEVGPQSYGKVADRWAVRPPGARKAAFLSEGHEVIEHDDGTISVKPSIIYSTPDRHDYFHGFLIRGRWIRLED